MNAKIEEADNQMEVLEEWVAGRKSEQQIQEQETRLKLQEEFQQKAEKKDLPTGVPVNQAKLPKRPKLVIMKFNGSLTDWPRFWSH